MRIMGIDPGLRLTGYGCLEVAGESGRLRVVEAGVIRLKANDPLPSRLGQLFAELGEILEETRPDLMVVEQLFSHYRHVRTSIIMGHARGVLILAAEQRGVEVTELGATEVKKAIAGNGHASKRQMQVSVMGQCGLASLPSPPDVADAIAIALCAARRLGADVLV